MSRPPRNKNNKKLFSEHLSELKNRTLISVSAVMVCAVAAFAVREELIRFLSLPFKETLYYTSPAGGLEIAVTVSLGAGVIAAFPIIIFQALSFILPIVSGRTKWLVVGYTLSSWPLAIGGSAFAYYISLPAALNLLSMFATDDIKSLIAADQYMRFIMIYLVGFAIMFQLPVVVLLINNISPLRPMKLLSYTGYVVLGSFIAAAILTPTPDPVNQTIMAGVPIVLYLVSILLIALGRVRWKSLLIWKRPRGRSELLPNGKPLT